MEGLVAFAGVLFAALVAAFTVGRRPTVPLEAPELPVEPVIEPPAPTVPSTVPESEGAAYSWEVPKDAFHLTRVMCDELGLTVTQKNIVCACIWQESRFMNRHADGTPITNANRDKRGNVWSTDYGIVQVNDYFHCGPGKTFPSVKYVMNNPDQVVKWMVLTMKRTGKLQPWSSYSTGAYKQWLKPSSPLWALKR